MKIRVLNIWTRMISLCLVLLGFNACNDESTEIPVEYGSPTADYKISGKVVTEENADKGVKDIRVVVIPDVDESKHPDLRGDTLKTSTDGSFLLEKKDFPTSKLAVKIQDVDGEANGLFEDQTLKINFTSEDYEGGDGKWYKGTATKDLGTITLATKKEEAEKE